MKKKTAGRSTSKKVAASRFTRDGAFEKLMETGGTVIEELRAVRFAGVSLAGGKTDKTAVAVIEYYPDRKRVFLRSLRERIRTDDGQTSDQALIHVLTEEEKELDSIAFDVPLQLPKCVRCEIECPGYEKCREPEIKWMNEVHKEREKDKRPNKFFTPYTERCAEIHIANQLEEPFHPSHALGANAAPLTARAHYLKRRLAAHVETQAKAAAKAQAKPQPMAHMVEVFPKLSLWRMGVSLRIPQSYLRFHRHAVDSDEARLYILKILIDKEIAFIYQQDMRLMVENSHVFDAFICALTGFLKFRGQTEKPPAGFPRGEQWIEYPKEKIVWF
jgi:hypothetical protein